MLLVTQLNLHCTQYLSVYKGQSLHYKPGQLVWTEEPEGGIGPGSGGEIVPPASEQGMEFMEVIQEERATRAINSLLSGEQTFLGVQGNMPEQSFGKQPTLCNAWWVLLPISSTLYSAGLIYPAQTGMPGLCRWLQTTSIPRKSLQNVIHSNFH